MENDLLLHIGIKRRSGRYPWGSGLDPYQRESFNFLSRVDALKDKNMSEAEIAKHLGLRVTELRSKVTLANKDMMVAKKKLVDKYHKEGMSNVDIAKKLMMSEASVRNYIKDAPKSAKDNAIDNVADALRRGVEKNKYLDVGIGVERQIGVSKEKLKAARQKLLDEGYVEHDIYIRQISDRSKWTTMTVLTKEKDLTIVNKNKDKIRSLEEWSEDGGQTLKKISPPVLIKLDRVKIRYAEDGGDLKDGLIELRRGVDDLDLGTAKYAQVRIGAEGRLYLKGMAMYTDDAFPKGVDIIFNTNKGKNVPKESVLKEMKDSRDFPFGATIKKQRGAINIVNEEGDWDTWSGRVSSQFLGKQPVALIKERLNDTYASIKKEYDQIMSLTNSTVKKHMLQEFSDGLDSKARDLKAKGFARTKSHVLIPFPDMKPDEVYAPNYKNGEKVVLIRHPHGGIFEIPQLTVNNNSKVAKRSLKDAIDAIGIHPSQAQKLSGADFDGDTVLVIPNNSGRIKHSRTLDDLRNFDNKTYQLPGKSTMKSQTTQIEMGKISNLITDMTIKNAKQHEIAAAVKHSMVVIDAQKHNLDYRQSAIDHGIKNLQNKYQRHVSPITGKVTVGAATLMSRAKNEKEAPSTTTRYRDKETGAMVTKTVKGAKTPQMDLVNDAYKLSSGSPQENAYADFANKLKAMRNETSKAVKTIPDIKRDPVAAKKYEKEVRSLDRKLNDALLNAPRERQAQLLATKLYYKNLTPDDDKDARKKLRSQTLATARATVIPDGKKKMVDITDREWEAIQNGAISQTKLKDILNNTNSDRVKQLATPKPTTKLSSAKATRARLLISRGYTYAEVAEQLGVSVSTISKYTSDNYKKE